MTTRKDLEAKCEELADNYWSLCDTDHSERNCNDHITFGFYECLNLTWPMIEELKARLDDERYEERQTIEHQRKLRGNNE
jgi:hypothetical protein